MTTTRRGAILAALLTPFAAFFGKPKASDDKLGRVGIGITEDYPVAFLQLIIPEQSPEYPYGHALEVRYKDRVARLTGDEIMDALEGGEE